MDTSTISGSIPGMLLLMSFIPAIFGFAGAILMVFYPLTDHIQQQMTQELIVSRNQGLITEQ